MKEIQDIFTKIFTGENSVDTLDLEGFSSATPPNYLQRLPSQGEMIKRFRKYAENNLKINNEQNQSVK